MKNIKDVTVNALLGQAIGDALGVPVEFMSRDDVRQLSLQTMVGRDTAHSFHSHWVDRIPAGAWSDDTSLTIAAMVAITDDGGEIVYEHIMERFLDWWEYGAFTASGDAFGLGGTTRKAFKNYVKGIPALACGQTGFEDNGNGSLMRILPFALYCIAKERRFECVVSVISNASSITHAHQISCLGCTIFTVFLKNIIAGMSAVDAWNKTRKVDYERFYFAESVDAYRFLLSDEFLTADDSCIGQTGYVVDTLMTAVYSLIHTGNFKDAVLTAINMGFDTDTAGAVTGALAGACYGAEQIPAEWKNGLLRADYVALVARQFAEAIAE